MAKFSRRQCLKAAGVSLAAISLGAGGTIVAQQAAIEPGVGPGAVGGPQGPGSVDLGPDGARTSVDIGGGGGAGSGPGSVAAPSGGAGPNAVAGGDVSGQAVRSGDRLDYERDDDRNIEFDYGDLSFETNNGDQDVELAITDGDVRLDFESDNGGDDLEVTLDIGSESIDLEADGADIELDAVGDTESFEDDDGEIEYKGQDIQLEWDDENKELDITGEIRLEWKSDELEFRGTGVQLEWEADGDFEARRL
ncbi:hypothetical protein [Halomarina litorea]|uniref:hypothetical protein n=1 Tax=Halomarina litorea TaxID=2961595 RepID=UPI0020C4B394|nr:hypothetical protein [Halomarina sp. BCD28]